MKGSIKNKILDILEDGAMAIADFHNAIISAGYGASYGRLEYEHNKRVDRRHEYQIYREEKRRVNKYIYKLKKDGIICHNSTGKIMLAKKGKDNLFMNKQNNLPDNDYYKKEYSDRFIVITYDIPVTYNKERRRIGEILSVLGFNAIQKSVWVGKMKIPKEFIDDLKKKKLLKYFEILEVTKSGSLESVH